MLLLHLHNNIGVTNLCNLILKFFFLFAPGNICGFDSRVRYVFTCLNLRMNGCGSVNCIYETKAVNSNKRLGKCIGIAIIIKVCSQLC